MKKGKIEWSVTIEDEKAKTSTADSDPQKNKLECKTMKRRICINIAEHIEEQEMLGLMTFFLSWAKTFYWFEFD